MRSRNSLMRERREAFRDARLIVIASGGQRHGEDIFQGIGQGIYQPPCACAYFGTE